MSFEADLAGVLNIFRNLLISGHGHWITFPFGGVLFAGAIT